MRLHLAHIALLLASLLPTLGLSEEAPGDPSFEAYLDGLVRAQFHDYKLAGMTFVLVQGDRVTLAKGYGLADIATGEPVEPNRHLFRPGSVSKLFTWTAVMQLVEKGKLDLNADVSEYVDQFEIPNAFNQPMTLSHIMTHTPGLEDAAAGILFEEFADGLIPLSDALGANVPTQIRAPGTHAAYSNWATALAGLVVANVSGQSFEAYIQDHILNPLQMPNATFEEPLPAHLAVNMATGYLNRQGTLAATGFEFIKNFGPAGALSTASSDMGNFIIAHLNDGRFQQTKILNPATTKLMHQNLFSHHEAVAAMAHGFWEKWRNGQRFIGHGGDTISFHSELVLDPENDFGFYLSFNAPDGARARAAIVDGIIDYFYPAPPARYSFDPIEGTAARITQVIGAYRINRRSYTKLEGIVALAGDISITPAGEGAIYLPSPIGGSKFFEVEPFVFDQAGGQGRLVFTANADGQVAHLLLATIPVIVAEKLGPFASAANHQLLIGLALLASLFILINTIRNRRDGLTGAAKRGRNLLAGAAASNLFFIVGLGAIVASVDMQRVVYDYPPAGLPFVLIFPVFSLFFTLGSLYYLWPVWQATDLCRWSRVRYSFVTILFVLYLSVLNYWHLIGWNY